MKNIKLIAPIFLTLVLCQSIIPVFAKSSTYTPKQLFEKNTKVDLAAKIKFTDNAEVSGGGKISLPFFESCFYSTTEAYNYGLLISNKCLNQKITITGGGGNFSFSGINSKINNPLINSSISPFSNISTASSSISVNFPGISSFSNPESYCCTITYFDSKKIVPFFNATVICIPDEKKIIQLQWKYNPNKIKFSFSHIAGFIHNEELESSSWFFSNNDTKYDFYIHEDNHFCNLNQFSFSYKNFSTLDTLGVYQGCFGEGFNFILKSENKFSINKSIINLSALLNNNQNVFLTSSNKKIENCFQTKIGFQQRRLIYLKTPQLFRFGSAFYFDTPVYYTCKENLKQTGKFSMGIQWIGQKQQTSLVMQSDFSIYPLSLFDKVYLNSINLTLKNNWNLDNINPSISTNLTYKKNETDKSCSFTEKLTLSVSFCKNPKFTIKSNFSCTQKDYLYDSCNFTLSAAMKFNINKVSVKITGSS